MDSRRQGREIKRSFGFFDQVDGASWAGSANPAPALALALALALADAGLRGPDDDSFSIGVQPATAAADAVSLSPPAARHTSMRCRIAFRVAW